jgi:hypothetical protein
MRHRIDDVIDAEPVGERGHLLGIIRDVGELPSVAYIGIVVHGNEYAVLVVIDGPPGLGWCRTAAPPEPFRRGRAGDGGSPG